MSSTLDELAEVCNATIKGEASCEIKSVNTLKSAQQGDITFLSNRHYVNQLPNTKASAVILTEADAEQCPTNALITDDPYLAYAKVVNYLYPRFKFEANIDKSLSKGNNTDIHETASIAANVVIGNNVKIGENTHIGPGCIIQDNVSIGSACVLIANITLCYDTQIANDVILHPGVVIGSDGFGLARSDNSWLKIPQIGKVQIFDKVEIGANSTIDRGAIEDTIINTGVKIDNQVQIGHNVIIGENTAIAGCTGVAGSVTIGKRCMIGGAVGISGHISIVDDVIITAKSGVSNSIKTAGVYSAGIPITDNKTWRRNIIRFKQLDSLIKKIMNRLDKD